jgi:heme O synthase-like polyprenyltransferase
VKKDNLTEAQIVAVIIQVFSTSSMFIGLWGMNGFFVAILLVVLAILFLKPSIDRRKKNRSAFGMSKLDSLDSQRGRQLLLFLLLIANAIMIPVISGISIAPAFVLLIYFLIAGTLFYLIWKKLDLRN